MAGTIAGIIEAAITLLDDGCVIPETADRVAVMLRANLMAGRHDGAIRALRVLSLTGTWEISKRSG